MTTLTEMRWDGDDAYNEAVLGASVFGLFGRAGRSAVVWTREVEHAWRYAQGQRPALNLRQTSMEAVTDCMGASKKSFMDQKGWTACESKVLVYTFCRIMSHCCPGLASIRQRNAWSY